MAASAQRKGKRAKTHVSGAARRRPRQARSRLTVAAIVEAAEQLLVEVGYAGASTNAIARRAGVSIGSLYQYFPDKDAVFRAVLSRHRERMRPLRERALAGLQDPDADLAGVIDTLLRETLAVRASAPALVWALEGELLAVAARWEPQEGGGRRVPGGKVARAVAARTGMPLVEARHRVWLATVLLEAAARRLVHDPLEGLDAGRLRDLAVATVTRLLGAGATG